MLVLVFNSYHIESPDAYCCFCEVGDLLAIDHAQGKDGLSHVNALKLQNVITKYASRRHLDLSRMCLLCLCPINPVLQWNMLPNNEGSWDISNFLLKHIGNDYFSALHKRR